MNELVSVIIPAFNHEKYVHEAIRSVIEQDYPTLELLILDDGSVDGTWRKIQEMKGLCEKRFARVRMARQENCGRTETLNRLLAEVRGKYVFLLASDDRVKTPAISILQRYLSKHEGCVLAVGDNEIIDKDSKRIFWDKRQRATDERSARYKTFGEFLKLEKIGHSFGEYQQLLLGNHIPNGYLIKTLALQRTGGYKKDIAIEDYAMCLQLAKLGTMKFFPSILYSYRWHALNTVKNKNYVRSLVSQYSKIFLGEVGYAWEKSMMTYLIWGWIRILLAIWKRSNLAAKFLEKKK